MQGHQSVSKKSAWEATLREDGGGAGSGKRFTTRAMRDRSTVKRQNVHGGTSEIEFKRIARLESLELTNAWDPLEKSLNIADDNDSSGDERGKRRRSDKRASSGAQKKQLFLADVIMNEGLNDFIRCQARPSTRPAVRVCDATGKEGRYKDPLTGLYVYDRRAIALLREQEPKWVKATAISPYWDAVRSVQAESNGTRVTQ